MANTELSCLSIAEAARLIAARKLSPLKLTDALLARTSALDPQVHAFITCNCWHATAMMR